MIRIFTLLVAVIGLAAIATPVSAADGCGRDSYWNGYRCAPMGGGYYERRDYGPPPGYYRRHANPDCYNYHGRRICCPRHWTVQNGVCTPYRGF